MANRVQHALLALNVHGWCYIDSFNMSLQRISEAGSNRILRLHMTSNL